MRIGQAKHIARMWVLEHQSGLAGFRGAFTTGSVNDLPDDAILAETSDIDLKIVFEDPDLHSRPGKQMQSGVLLEPSHIAASELCTPGHVLGHYHLAGSFQGATILADPDGDLTRLQSAVAGEFAKREWIEHRCQQATQTVVDRLDAITTQASFAGHVMSWLFAAGGVPHVLLVAGLRNPTVRKRYLAVKQLLEDTGHADLYPDLLAMLGCRDWSPEQVTRHLDAVEDAFDAAAEVIRTPFFFAADISADAKPVAIGGSRELISMGHHREAVFWIVATACRCQLVLHADALADQAYTYDGAFAALMSDLGIASVDDLSRRGDEMRRELPRVRSVAESIMDRVAMTSSS